ncbi:hypothetical protein JHK84_048368 [Glycine max]|uniref:Uncharacterized protein n=1 Tax=Glycine soja TaxID=3848 RepID=A0A0B2SNG1_GLYSO|nr:hypothetical protein JHK86_048336 [Glycine max]KAG4934124.1 hypothetical protein JHK87_048126 [Glycine soja]KAG5103399.1 hypothetical protein JHK84_048368 [Glycine max]KHN46353.1 hypothetical protein glysoja_036431 [Glycine soja]
MRCTTALLIDVDDINSSSPDGSSPSLASKINLRAEMPVVLVECIDLVKFVFPMNKCEDCYSSFQCSGANT